MLAAFCCVKVQDVWLLSVEIPNVLVTLGYHSSSGTVNTKAAVAVPILLY